MTVLQRHRPVVATTTTSPVIEFIDVDDSGTRIYWIYLYIFIYYISIMFARLLVFLAVLAVAAGNIIIIIITLLLLLPLLLLH